MYPSPLGVLSRGMQALGRRVIAKRASTSMSAAVTQDLAAKQKAYVRYKPGEDHLTISLAIAGRQRNLKRPVDEPLEKPLSRLRANLAPEKGGKKAKKKPRQQQQQEEGHTPTAAADAAALPADVEVLLFEDEAATQVIPVSTPNLDAWLVAGCLKVGPTLYTLTLNPPTIEALALHKYPLVGYPLLPTISCCFCCPGHTTWRWYRQQQGGGPWEDTGARGLRYSPVPSDLGCLIKVEAIPGRLEEEGSGNSSSSSTTIYNTMDVATAVAAAVGGPGSSSSSSSGRLLQGEAVAAVTGPVSAGPSRPAAVIRSPGGAAAAAATAPGFRVMSYNILADQYAGTAYAQQVLFKYCPTQLLDNQYRRQLVMQEVLAYQPDVLCLQEVDDKVFTDYLAPHLALEGYTGTYTNKQGRVREGSAMFWRSSRFRAVATQDVLLRDVFKPPLAPLHQQFTPLLASSPALVEALQKVTTIAQMVLLLPTTDTTTTPTPAPGGNGSSSSSSSSRGVAGSGPLLVINTHLFFHPYAPHIRSIHTAAILEEAQAAVAAWTNPPSAAAAAAGGGGGPLGPLLPPDQVAGLLSGWSTPPSVMFCGDLNSDLNDGVPGVVELLNRGRLPADHWDWKNGLQFRWGKEEGDYSADEEDTTQQKQQQQHPTAAAAAANAGGGAAAAVSTSSSFTPLKDGHDFDPPAASPTAPVESTGVVGLDLVSPYTLTSADDLKTPYTNYTSGYKALLDYVWYEKDCWEVTGQLPTPTPEELGCFIPNPAFPSDHLAVVYEFRPRQQQQLPAPVQGRPEAES